MGDPTNVFAMDDIKFMTGYNVEPVVASEIASRKAIDKHYGTPRSVVLKEACVRPDFNPESSLKTSWLPRR
jgi:type IV pilus assembly protein PilB